jgi:hypothetical protein
MSKLIHFKLALYPNRLSDARCRHCREVTEYVHIPCECHICDDSWLVMQPFMMVFIAFTAKM